MLPKPACKSSFTHRFFYSYGIYGKFFLIIMLIQLEINFEEDFKDFLNFLRESFQKKDAKEA